MISYTYKFSSNSSFPLYSLKIFHGDFFKGTWIQYLASSPGFRVLELQHGQWDTECYDRLLSYYPCLDTLRVQSKNLSSTFKGRSQSNITKYGRLLGGIHAAQGISHELFRCNRQKLRKFYQKSRNIIWYNHFQPWIFCKSKSKVTPIQKAIILKYQMGQ